MLNLFGKKRELFVNKEDLTKVFVILDQYDLTSSDLANIKFGNCGWKAAPNCWFIMFNATDRIWFNVLKNLAKEDIKLIPETAKYGKGE